ncbi:MAG: hypothetical protein ACRDMV_16645 [Streptosporangiales bacterium]
MNWPRRLDLQLAATAARHELALLARNGADFTGLESAVTVLNLSARHRGYARARAVPA